MRLIIIAVTCVLPLSAMADSMRCGQSIVTEDMIPAELLKKCGEPQNKDVTKSDVFAKNPAGYSTKRGEQVIERWYYKPSSGSLTMMVKIMDGKITSIERAD